MQSMLTQVESDNGLITYDKIPSRPWPAECQRSRIEAVCSITPKGEQMDPSRFQKP